MNLGLGRAGPGPMVGAPGEAMAASAARPRALPGALSGHGHPLSPRECPRRPLTPARHLLPVIRGPLPPWSLELWGPMFFLLIFSLEASQHGARCPHEGNHLKCTVLVFSVFTGWQGATVFSILTGLHSAMVFSTLTGSHNSPDSQSYHPLMKPCVHWQSLPIFP